MLDKEKKVSVLEIIRFILDDEVPNSYAVLDGKMLEETIPNTFDLLQLILDNLIDLAYDCYGRTDSDVPNKCKVKACKGIEDLVKKCMNEMNEYQLTKIKNYAQKKTLKSSFY